MRTALFLLAACLAITSTFAKPSQEERAWWTFKAKFGKKYETPKEEETRRNLFLQSRDRMDRHNERYLAGLESHTKGINQFSDMVSHSYICRIIKQIFLVSRHLVKFNKLRTFRKISWLVYKTITFSHESHKSFC